ncbi:MAG: MarR family transcriptional regulator [Burkholderiaceae bacterium]|jgi:MarR family transcriptional repressor of emrRAB|nr:MarR family transcriptional regulator [Burkholderiaceae bacterium]
MSYEDELRRSLERHAGAPVPQILATRLLMRAAALLRARMDAALAREGIDMRGYLALVSISLCNDEALRPSDLSVLLDATRTQVTRILDALARQKLVMRAPSREDRRTLNLTLTAAGQRKLARCLPKAHAVYQQVWSGVAHFTPVMRDLRALNTQLLMQAPSEGIHQAVPKLPA